MGAFMYRKNLQGSLSLGKQYRGFTLIEMMVSVAIFGVMASIIFPALIQFLDARDRIDVKHEKIIGMQKTFLFLAQDLRFASNRLGKDEFGDLGKSTLRVGEDDNLIELTALYPDLNLNGTGVPRRVKWRVEDDVLQRIQYPVMDPDQDTRIIRQNLLKGVQSVDVKLLHIQEGRSVETGEWESETKLPDQLEIVVELDSGIEYRRVFTMLSADKLDAIAISLSTGSANGNEGESNEGDAANNRESDAESTVPVNNEIVAPN